MDEMKNLFSPGKIGSLYLKNRIVMAPLGSRLTSENGAVTDDMIEFYYQRAKGGTGLIIIEAMGIDYPLAVGKPNHVRFNDECYMPGHAKLVERIHEGGSKVFPLLWHCGINRGMLEGQTPVGPSAILNPNTGIVPRELTTDEIHELVCKFGLAANRAMKCGYDGISVHAAHGYLISSFVSRATNRRTDEYGGSFENRIRFALEVYRSIRKNTRKDFPIIFRINGNDFIEDGITPEEAVAFAKALEKEGIDGLDVSAGVYGSIDTMIEPIQYPEGWKLYLAEKIRKNVKIPVFGVGVIHSPQVANEAIASGKVDFVSMGRELLCEPEWAKKARAGEEHFPRCIGCNACFERIGYNATLRCAINPLAGRERHVPEPAAGVKKIAVAGAGPGGITAAVTAARRGHKVTLYEKENQIGGQLLLAGTPPHKEKILDYIDYLREEIDRAGVTLLLDHEFTAGDADGFDEVIVAAGAECRSFVVPGAEDSSLTAWEALKQQGAQFEGKDIIVVGAGSVGCETALFLKEKGAASVSIVELREKALMDMDNISRMKLLKELKEQQIVIYTSTVLERVRDKKGSLKGAESESRKEIPCGLVVTAVGSVSNRSLAEDLYKKGISAYYVGDSASIGKIGEAVRSGFDAAANI